jgi:hypothetical protein
MEYWLPLVLYLIGRRGSGGYRSVDAMVHVPGIAPGRPNDFQVRLDAAGIPDYTWEGGIKDVWGSRGRYAELRSTWP